MSKNYVTSVVRTEADENLKREVAEELKQADPPDAKEIFKEALNAGAAGNDGNSSSSNHS